MAAREVFGISPALVTPLAPDGAVALAPLMAHANDLLARGCTSVTLFGTTGEGPSFSLRERDETAARVLAEGLPAGRLIEGIIACAIDEAAEALRKAAARKVRAVLLAPPFYFRGGPDEALFAWFEAVFRQAGAGFPPVLLYHIPGMTGVPLSHALIARLKAAFPGAILGIKDSAANRPATEALLAAHGDLTILVGDERYLGAAVAQGAGGAICGMGNLLPERMVRIVREKRDDPAIVDLVTEIVRHPVIPAMKALTADLRADERFAAPRPPLAQLDGGVRAALSARVAALAGPLEAVA